MGPIVPPWFLDSDLVKETTRDRTLQSNNSLFTMYLGDAHSAKPPAEPMGAPSVCYRYSISYQISSFHTCFSCMLSTLYCCPNYSCAVSIKTPPCVVLLPNFCFPARALISYLCRWLLNELFRHLKLRYLVLLSTLYLSRCVRQLLVMLFLHHFL